MTTTALGSIPEGLPIGSVWSVHYDGAHTPATILGRRAAYDELIYDDEGGFSSAWAGFSSITPADGGGFTIVLGRRAYSAAGLAVFALDGSGGGGGGGGAVSSVFGRTGGVDAEQFDYNTSQILNVASVSGESLSQTLEQLHAAIGGSSEAYRGKTTGLLAYGTSFGDLPGMVYSGFWDDDGLEGISRSGADFTVTLGGYYRLSLLALATASATSSFTTRVMVSGSPVAGNTTPITAFEPNYVTLDAVLWLAPSATVTVECKMSVAGSWSTTAPDSGANAQLTLVRLGA